jgi:hypothetical protein
MDKITAGNGRRIQARKPRKDGFTDAKRQIVLDQLAGCANLSRAAAAAGITPETVNYHRRRDPAFRQQVIEAIEAGYEALEAMAIDWAATGKAYRPGDTEVPGPETMDPNVALHLLRLRRAPPGQRTGRAGYEPKRASEKELNESILAKLDLLDRRLRPRRDQARKLKTRAAVAALAVLRDGASPGSSPGSAPPQDERGREGERAGHSGG